MITYKEVESFIEQEKKQFYTYWMEVGALESPTHNKKAVDLCGDWFIRYAKKQGWEVSIKEESQSGNPICITMNPKAEGPFIALSGHLDTVHEIGSFGSPAVHIDDEHIYGPGVLDCKGGVMAGLLAMTALQKLGYTERKVKLLLQTDEETGSRGSEKRTIRWIGEQAQGAIAFFNLEGARKDHGLVVSRKGIMRFRLDVHGKAVHSCACYKGANAILEAAYKIQALEVYKDPDGITCNVGTICGGTVPNSVPDSCSFQVDVRFATSEQEREITQVIYSIGEHATIEGTTCDVTLISTRVSMEKTEKNLALLRAINQVLLKHHMEPHGETSSNGGSDAADITSYGIPCLDGFGVLGDHIHSTREFAYLSSLETSSKELALLILEL